MTELTDATRMLALLYVAKRGICAQADIRYALGLSHDATYRAINHWCKKQLLERLDDPVDGRYKLVTLTPEGQAWYAMQKGKPL